MALRALTSRGLASGEPVERFVWIPVLVNSQPVPAGAEIRAMKESITGPHRPKTTVSIDASMLVKRAKLC